MLRSFEANDLALELSRDMDSATVAIAVFVMWGQSQPLELP